MTAISVRGVGKRYWQLEETPMLLNSLLPFRPQKKTERWALRDIDLTLEVGDTVGVIGRNGAGKTTLLRLLSGVTRPSEGRIEIVGRVAPLIGVGIGFHNEMSGRENVYVNGMLLGLTKQEVKERFDEIVAFSEIEEFIDTPVKFYSTGMFMRLGFAVAAHVNPDVLLVDEILAVGDWAFQAKCFERMRQLQSNGTTILMVSHSLHAIRFLCPRAVVIRRGKLEFDGPADEALALHHELMVAEHAEEMGGHSVTIMNREILAADGATYHAQTGDYVTYRATVRFDRTVISPRFHFEAFGEDGSLAYSITSAAPKEPLVFHDGDTVEVTVPVRINLVSGTYRLRLTAYDQFARETLAHDAEGLAIYVRGQVGRTGVADLEASVKIDGVDMSDYGNLLIGPSQPVDVRRSLQSDS